MSKRAYVELADGAQTHYRCRGGGLPLILLHASPLSSAWMEPTMAALPEGIYAVAPDTPGYGASDPLTEPGEDLSGYAAWLRQFIAALGFERVGVYGSSTGAQIAIEFARAWPEAARFLVLDNAAHFTDAEREYILARYFPDLSPREDGAHLRKAWEMVNATWQWFPWFEQDEEHRFAQADAVPLETRQAMLVDQLRAGPDYARAYRGAFLNEDANRLFGVSAPTRIIRWRGGMLRKYADRLDDMGLPANIGMVHCGPTMEQRLAAIGDAVAELVASTRRRRLAGGSADAVNTSL
ncbi:MAG: alpha/beta hydrolase [Gammaproteobacteria bacterium]|nr:alpha/beta hydrolase [Gammaproteobacteria bacterium]MYL13404.1 alpha/beta hydrolase [Gammaproteobacteria bacterium]